MLNAEVATSATTGVVVAGNFSFNPISGLLDAGENVEVWITFTPIDTRNFKVSEFKITVTINKANPTFEQSDFDYDFDFGELLGKYSTELNENEVALGVDGIAITGTFEFVNTEYRPSAGYRYVQIRFTPSIEFSNNYNIEYFYLRVSVGSGNIGFDITVTHTLTYGEELRTLEEALLTFRAFDRKDTHITIEGEFKFVLPLNTILEADTHIVEVEFIPNDSNYSPVTFEIEVIVNPSEVEFDQIHEYTYTFGENLNTLLDLLNTEIVTSKITGLEVAGTFSFQTGTAVLNATDETTVTIIFTPTGTNFLTLTTTLTIKIDRADPSIPDFVGTYVYTFGQPLSTLIDILIAETTNIPGTFSFLQPTDTPDAGLEVQISVVFTPEDLINYNERTFYLTVRINPQDPDMSGVVIEPIRVTFNGQNHTVDLNDLVLPTGVEIDRIEYSNRRDVGTHSFTVFFKVTNATNFIVPDSKTGSLVILPAEDGPNWLLIGVAGGAGALVLVTTIAIIIRNNRLKKLKTGNLSK
jgi:hypothetical protein